MIISFYRQPFFNLFGQPFYGSISSQNSFFQIRRKIPSRTLVHTSIIRNSNLIYPTCPTFRIFFVTIPAPEITILCGIKYQMPDTVISCSPPQPATQLAPAQLVLEHLLRAFSTILPPSVISISTSFKCLHPWLLIQT